MKNCSDIKKRILIILLAALTAFSLCACAEVRIAEPMDDAVFAKVGDIECPLAEAVFRLMEVKDYYRSDEDAMFWDRAIGDTTFEGYIKGSVQEEILKLTACVTMAEERAIYLTDEEISALTKAATDSYNAVAAAHDMGRYSITVSTAIEVYKKQALYNKIFEKVSENVNFEISDTDTKVIEINYVEIPLDVSVNQAEAFRSEVRNGTSFETACRANGWTPVMNQVMTKGTMPTTFENVAYELIDGELSEIIESVDCMYIIQCVEDYMITESVANKNRIVTQARQAEFDKCYEEYASRTILRFNDEAWNKITVSTL